MAFNSDAERWTAVEKRDRRAEGVFFYGVKTTGVYCRPTCSARLPNRKNVVFFTSFSEAEGAGYRPCRRCSPKSPSAGDYGMALVGDACRLMEEATEPPVLEDLAAAVGLSPSHLHRLFKKVLGVTPKEYSATLRMNRIKKGLAPEASVTQAIYEAGFNSSSRFYEKTMEILGMTAGKYKKGAAGLRIRFAVADSFLGKVLVAATDHGLCAIEFSDSPAPLVERLRTRFPRAELDEDDAGFVAWVSKVTEFIETPARGLDLPLDIQGTAFQQRVWKALRQIPPGSTSSYTEVAARIGRPKAVRAVARACASNPIAVAVPCHRVIRRNGGLGGYKWGLERKRALLEREAETVGEEPL
ncbi:MAG: bifunctional DNA-binding transcriptional regulator/O6-methylguanine-DNA methyltransferase Ada [Thermodesulfobacteriota bacterium]